MQAGLQWCRSCSTPNTRTHWSLTAPPACPGIHGRRHRHGTRWGEKWECRGPGRVGRTDTSAGMSAAGAARPHRHRRLRRLETSRRVLLHVEDSAKLTAACSSVILMQVGTHAHTAHGQYWQRDTALVGLRFTCQTKKLSSDGQAATLASGLSCSSYTHQCASAAT